MKHIDWTILLAFLIAISGCELIEKGETIGPPSWNPSFAVPLVDTEVKLADILDMIDSTEFVEIDHLGNISIVYETDLITATGRDMLYIPYIPVPMFTTEMSIPFPVDNIEYVSISDGWLYLSFESNESEDIVVDIEVEQLNASGARLSQSFVFSGAGLHRDSMNLGGFDFDLNDGNLDFSYSAVRQSDGTTVSLDNFSFELVNLSYSYAEGYFGQYQFDLGQDSVELGIDEGLQDLEFWLDDPSLTFYFNNSFGVPIQIRMQNFEVLDGNNEMIDILSQELEDGVTLNFPSSAEQGQSKYTEITLDQYNSSLREAIASFPTAINWKFDAISHPSGDENERGFILDTSEFTVGIAVDVPLKGSFKPFETIQTFDLEVDAINEIAEGGIRMITQNSLPLEVGVQVYLLDESDQILDSLFDQSILLLEGAPIDQLGNVTGSGDQEIDVDIPENKLEALWNMRKMQIKASLSTSQEGTVPVQFSTENGLRIQLGARGTVQYE